MKNKIMENWKKLAQSVTTVRKAFGRRVIAASKMLGRLVTAARKEAVLRAAGLLAGGLAFVWWCVLYPELCFPQDTYAAVSGEEESGNSFPQSEEENVRSLPQSEEENVRGLLQSEEENLHSLLQAEEEQVIVKSRLLEWLEQHGYIR